jgi:hypothetical protein
MPETNLLVMTELISFPCGSASARYGRGGRAHLRRGDFLLRYDRPGGGPPETGCNLHLLVISRSRCSASASARRIREGACLPNRFGLLAEIDVARANQEFPDLQHGRHHHVREATEPELERRDLTRRTRCQRGGSLRHVLLRAS